MISFIKLPCQKIQQLQFDSAFRQIGTAFFYNCFTTLPNQVNHSADITSEGSSWEIKGKGLFGREVMFSLRTPVDVKSGKQVQMYNFSAVGVVFMWLSEFIDKIGCFR